MRTYVRLAVGALALAFLVPQAGSAAVLPPLQVFTDAAMDGVVLAEATPEAQDLVAGFISETDTTISFTWQVVDILDGTTGVPDLINFFFEIGITRPTGGDPALFSIRARMTRAGGAGDIQGNCAPNEAGVIVCSTIPGVVDVKTDAVANTVTATVKKKDLKASGASVAVDGAVITEAVLFQGIASYVSHQILTSSATGDLADMDVDYVIGAPRT